MDAWRQRFRKNFVVENGGIGRDKKQLKSVHPEDLEDFIDGIIKKEKGYVTNIRTKDTGYYK